MRVLVVTIVHDPRDARIRHRQIEALISAGHHVVFAAPFSGYGLEIPSMPQSFDLPRAQGRRRLDAIRAARRLIEAQSGGFDITLIHDPELLVAATSSRSRVTVWDVHEDTAAAVSMKPWLPTPVRTPTARGVKTLEKWAEGKYELLLAETAYAQRFSKPHPIVPNSTSVPGLVPQPGTERVTYVGAISRARGADEMIEVGRLLRLQGISLELIGSADQDSAPAIHSAHERGDVFWHGFLPNDQSMRVLEGSLAGLSLLHDEPNYRDSQPTKVLEYMAHGLPVITTPLPRAREIVEEFNCGLVVPFQDAAAVAGAVERLRADRELRESLARQGHAAAIENFNWDRDQVNFINTLQAWVNRDDVER